MPTPRLIPLPGLFLTPAPARAEPQVMPLILPEASELFLIDAAHMGVFLLMVLAIICLPRRR
jgi:hypothetical protein